MSKLKFEPDDFPPACGIDRSLTVKYAQARFDEWLREQRVVTGWFNDVASTWGFVESSTDTHKAYLVGIEPIKKEPCKHEPHRAQLNFEGGGSREWIQPTCIHCGAKLRPVFEVVE